jgi:VanZ like family
MVVLMIVAIGVATLTPSDQLNPWPWYCLWCDEQALADAVVNVVMFIPLGAALRAADVRSGVAIAASAALATTVEVLQGTVITGRDPSLRDAMTNTLGAAIGVLIVARWRHLVLPTRRTAAWLATAAAVVWLSTLVVSGIAVRPCAPPTPFDAEWSPVLPHENPFQGRVVGATLYGDSLRDGPLPAAMRDRMQTGRIALTTRVIPDADRFNSATMLAVVGFQRIALSIAHSRRSVVVALPQCFWRLRLRPTMYMLSRGLEVAFRGDAPGPGLVTVDATPMRVDIAVEGDSGRRQATSLRITPFFGWSLVRPFDARVRTGTRWITALWIAGFLLPFGYWWARLFTVSVGTARAPNGQLIIGVAAMAVVLFAGLGGISHWLALSGADALEWCEALAGVAAGIWLAHRPERRHSADH